MSINPVEIPTGAVRYNTDSNKMEVYIGSTWMEVAVSSPNLDGGTRGVHNLGQFSPALNTLEFLTISTQGNSTDFGDATKKVIGGSSPSSRTRGLFGGGNEGAPAYGDSNIIDFITFASTGNATDFGDTTVTLDYGRGNVSNGTRGLFFGKRTVNNICFVTIASTGNALDFGDFNENIGGGPVGASSPTRGIFAGGYHPSPSPFVVRTRINFVTISTKGDTEDFGDLTVARAHSGVCGNATRILIASGYSAPSAYLQSIDKITTSTLGNATDFGDTSFAAYGKGSTSSATRGLFIGGAPTASNVIDYNQIATEGNSVDFGDIGTGSAWIAACSNGHGGL